jgi:hypothetical protein
LAVGRESSANTVSLSFEVELRRSGEEHKEGIDCKDRRKKMRDQRMRKQGEKQAGKRATETLRQELDRGRAIGGTDLEIGNDFSEGRTSNRGRNGRVASHSTEKKDGEKE